MPSLWIVGLSRVHPGIAFRVWYLSMMNLQLPYWMMARFFEGDCAGGGRFMLSLGRHGLLRIWDEASAVNWFELSVLDSSWIYMGRVSLNDSLDSQPLLALSSKLYWPKFSAQIKTLEKSSPISFHQPHFLSPYWPSCWGSSCSTMRTQGRLDDYLFLSSWFLNFWSSYQKPLPSLNFL